MSNDFTCDEMQSAIFKMIWKNMLGLKPTNLLSSNVHTVLQATSYTSSRGSNIVLKLDSNPFKRLLFSIMIYL